MQSKTKLNFSTAVYLVIANMIGTGVFTSLGFQLQGISNIYSILLLWCIGMVISFFGALSYAELAVTFNQNGGEYNFLTNLYHPFVGFFAGVVSLLVGFAAPVALAAMALAAYLNTALNLQVNLFAVLVILLVSMVHSFSTKSSIKFQSFTTILKLFVIILFIGVGIFSTSTGNAITTQTSLTKELISGSFAVSLIYVTYSFSGWNAAAYITADIKDAQKQIPKALLISVVLVGVIYLLIQVAILKNASHDQLIGKTEVALIAVSNIVGNFGSKIFLILLSVILISSISAMVWVGSRVSNVIAKDYPVLSVLSYLNKNNIPVRSIWFQAIVSIGFILTNSFQLVLTYCGLALQLCITLTVSGLFILRKRNNINKHFKSPFYPTTQIIFILLNLWIIAYTVYTLPSSIYFLVGLVLTTAIFYQTNKFIKQKQYTND